MVQLSNLSNSDNIGVVYNDKFERQSLPIEDGQ